MFNNVSVSNSELVTVPVASLIPTDTRSAVVSSTFQASTMTSLAGSPSGVRSCVEMTADVGDLKLIAGIADARAENGAEQNRLMQVMEFLEVNYTNMEAAHGRIMDTDIAAESTRFARNNVLVQSGAAMTAQANQLTKIVLSLIN